MIRSVYLSGPDVFRPDAEDWGRGLVALCARHGVQGLYPLDLQLPAGLDPPAQARWILQANLALIEQADGVIANLDFFRGAEPDSGTCFEVGYAVARGKPVVGYIPDGGSLAQRLRARWPQRFGPGLLDADGWRLEEFGLPLNLMLAASCRIVVGDAGVALAALLSP